FETYIPLVAAAAATIGPAVQSNRFIRRCYAKTSSKLAWAADKRYSLAFSPDDRENRSHALPR
ncbi:MAG: hypothetical protein ACT6RP_13060, partial [Roseateles sp.]|uniref:hypothetical protein n=1 Tax=Roseateles sp. TaxID=1971397 RepID=UPI00403611D4